MPQHPETRGSNQRPPPPNRLLSKSVECVTTLVSFTVGLDYNFARFTPLNTFHHSSYKMYTFVPEISMCGVTRKQMNYGFRAFG